ncbi:MAG: PQQ-dependent sugar dehydrogenase [Planctomycetes bacterium]|nr:PQQ-dependent sugar dehydrogenase [Planctomycetota bacterium]
MFRSSFRSTAIVLSALAGPLAAQSSMHTIRVASGVSSPVGVSAPVGDFNRLFIIEQGSGSTGRLRLLDLTQNPPVLQATPYLTVTSIQAGGEEGLLGLAFHPDFANNGYFFVYNTIPGGNNRVVRYRANAPFTSSTSADPTSAMTVMTINHPSFSNHNGGWIGFGPDGYLYIDTGDGGSGNDPSNNAQNLGSRLGKQMRIDIDGDDFPADTGNNYAIPPTNPFLGVTGALPEIWHYGLRNPWRASFDRLTGDQWIGDVGQGAIEEVDFVPAGVGGLNFGWRCTEGNNCTGLSGCVCNGPLLTPPVHAYPHTGGNCTVVGGYRYHGSAMCSFQGLYFFADYCSAHIWSFEWDGTSTQHLTDRTTELAPGGGLSISSISSFGEDAAGELYVCDLGGEVFKLVPGPIVDCNGNGVHDGCDLASGASHDWNGNGVLDECEPTLATPSCFGDGTTATACPCANNGAAGRGCENSDATGGARLDGAGDPANDEVVLVSSGELPSVLTIFLQGDAANPAGAVFGDGLLCVSGVQKLLYVKHASAGVAHAPEVGEASVTVRSSQLGDQIFPLSGAVRRYQAYYRDPAPNYCSAPAGSTWNVSSMLTITW